MLKNLFKLLLCVFLFINANSFAQKYNMRFTQVHYEFLGNPKVDYTGKSTIIKQQGFGGSIYTGTERFGAILEYNHRIIDLRNLKIPEVKSISIDEVYIGGRYYPMRPTMMLGNIAIRLTAGFEAGFDMEPNWRFLFFSGLTFSPITSISGISVNFIYRPETLPASGYSLEPSWAIRVGLIIGPSLKK